MSMLPAWAHCPLVRQYAHGQPAGDSPKVLAIGNFDGIHLGHAWMIERICSVAAERGLESAVLTFEPMPAEFFRGAEETPRLSALADKALYLAAAHPDLAALVAARFDRAFADLSPDSFVREVLRDDLQVRHLVVGEDFRFGRNRQGDIGLLGELAPACGFSLEIAQTQEDREGRISSTRIREALGRGDIATAERLLGHPYTITAEVVAGDRIGRTLGFPTANLDFPHNPPVRGIFAAHATVGDRQDLPAAVSIGTRPSVGGTRLVLEAHLLDFEGDLYGAPLAVRFVERLREERRYASVDELRAQIEKDVDATREILRRES